MKKYSAIASFLLFISLSSCIKDPPDTITSFTASQGSYIGIIHLAAESVPGAENYSYERKNPLTNQWEEIAWFPSSLFDDTGWGLSENKLLPGVEYDYRVRAHANNGGFGEYSPVATGHMFKSAPALKKVSYAKTDGDFYDMTLEVTDRLPDPVYNLRERKVYIYRSETAAFGDYFHNFSYDGSKKDSILFSTISVTYDKSKEYYYKIIVIYRFDYQRVTTDNELVYDENGEYTSESAIIQGSDITEDQGTADYQITDLGNINSSATGAKNKLIMCADGTNAYLGYLDAYNTAASTGKPLIMKYDDQGWSLTGGTLPQALSDDNTIDQFDMDVSSGTIYLAAHSSDTMHIYKYNGVWSENMVNGTIYGTDDTGYPDIAVLNNELYLAIEHDEVIKTFRYNSGWTESGTVTSPGFYGEINLRNLGGTLYLWYVLKEEGTSKATLFIKHMEGSSWVEDLNWLIDGAQNFEVIKIGSTLYFKYDTFDAKGNVCQVASASAATELIQDYEGIMTPKTITADSDGNIIISYITGTSVEDLHHDMLIYNGSEWQQINDDLTEASYHGNTGRVIAIENTIHFVYGLKSGENEWNIPTVFKAKKYTK